MALFLQIILILFFPAFALWFKDKSSWSKWLSPIVLCYLLGILLKNTGVFPILDTISLRATEASILIAIPLLLFNTRLQEARSSAGPAIKSFVLCVIAGLISCILATLMFSGKIEEAWKIGGMLVGIYTGGTPNMQAIGLALQASEETIILLNAADIITGGFFLILLTSFLPRLLSRWMPAYEEKTVSTDINADIPASDTDLQKPGLTAYLFPFLGSIGVVALSVGLCFLLFGNLEQTGFIMLALTTFSILSSFIPRVKNWQKSFAVGEYFLLIFSVALGMLADINSILSEGGTIIAFTAVAMYGCIFLHYLFARIFKIDRDTFLISSTAALYGPAFIGQIASVLGNKQIVFAGMTLGLLGYAVGNYLGIGLATLLKWITI